LQKVLAPIIRHDLYATLFTYGFTVKAMLAVLNILKIGMLFLLVPANYIYKARLIA
jgi:hypothetical protein